MKNVLIVEASKNYGLGLINESAIAGENKYILGGKFTELGVVNRNNRIYTESNFIPCLNEMKERMSMLTALYGEFDHPESFDISMQKASHIVKEVNYNPETRVVEGKIQLLSNYWGQQARAIVNDGLPLFVSSRAAGVTESNGTVTLKKLFTYDIVADPGFASAKMECINESCGYTTGEETFRIFEMKDPSKTNDFINMNKSENISRLQLEQYSVHITEQIAKTQKEINEAVKKGNISQKKLEAMFEQQSENHETLANVIEHINYLTSKLQYFIDKSEKSDTVIENLVKENKTLSRKQSQTMNYVDYLSTTVDKGFSYVQYVAENLDKGLGFIEHVAENVNEAIDYIEYVAEEVDHNTNYLQYISENLDRTIGYAEHINEGFAQAVEYIEYIAEATDENLSYTSYVAEKVDQTVSYAAMISEKLNGSKMISESIDGESNSIPTPEEFGFDISESEEYESEPVMSAHEEAEMHEEECPTCETDIIDNSETEENTPNIEEEQVALESAIVTEETSEIVDTENVSETPISEVTPENSNLDKDAELSRQIDELIASAKKQKANETKEHHFLTFLTKSQIDAFYALPQDQQESIVLYLNEKRNNFFSANEVLILMNEAIKTKNETLEAKLVRLLPTELKESWESLAESEQVSVFSQAKLLESNLIDESTIENFWYTRKMKTPSMVNESKSAVDSDTLSDEEFKAFCDRLKKL